MEEIKKKKKGPIVVKPGEYNTEYDNPELREEIITLRNDGKSWEGITETIQDKFNTNATRAKIREIYQNELAKATIHNKSSGDLFKKHEKELGARYERVVKITDWLLDAIEKVRDEFESSDMEDMQKYLMFIKMTPQINATVKSVLEQLDFIRKENERIKVEQKNFIYSPTQINQHLYSSLQMLNKQGFIKILKKLPNEDTDTEEKED